eukprot:1983625-Rhodomonas_salina.1
MIRGSGGPLLRYGSPMQRGGGAVKVPSSFFVPAFSSGAFGPFTIVEVLRWGKSILQSQLKQTEIVAPTCPSFVLCPPTGGNNGIVLATLAQSA